MRRRKTRSFPRYCEKGPPCPNRRIKEDADSDTGYNTEIVAGKEEASRPNNGWDTWNQVYLEYDFGKPREVKSVEIYRNTYPEAHSTFKDVKVELSEAEDFSDKTVIFDTADVKKNHRRIHRLLQYKAASS